jgi:CDP-diacylglycerol--glycerol-3-phosphate 3-phosphatidyltransferase
MQNTQAPKKATPFMEKIPNALTLFRVILIPFYVLFYYLPFDLSNLAAAVIFIVASLTDLLDGYLARKWQVCSRFGAFLDPVADKIMVCVALILMVSHYSKYEANYFPYISVIITLCAIVVVSREIVISALREWMAEVGSRARVAVSWIGKWKTTIQMIAISGLIWRHNMEMVYLALAMLLVAVVLTIWSMIDYIIAGVRAINEKTAALAREPKPAPKPARDNAASEEESRDTAS